MENFDLFAHEYKEVLDKSLEFLVKHLPCAGVHGYDISFASIEHVVFKGYRVRTLILRWKNSDSTLFDQSPHCFHVIGTNN